MDSGGSVDIFEKDGKDGGGGGRISFLVFSHGPVFVARKVFQPGAFSEREGGGREREGGSRWKSGSGAETGLVGAARGGWYPLGISWYPLVARCIYLFARVAGVPESPEREADGAPPRAPTSDRLQL